MAIASDSARIDTASRTILAPPRDIFRAMTDAESVASWRPPKGMHARIESFDARAGGGYRMAFIYDDPAPGVVGKSSEREDRFAGQFVEMKLQEMGAAGGNPNEPPRAQQQQAP